MDTLSANLENLLLALPFFLVLIGTLALGKWIYIRTSPYSLDAEILERDNPAIGIHFALFLLGLMIAVTGTLLRGRFFDWIGGLLVIGFAVLSIGLMRLSIWINDRFLLRQFSIYQEMVNDRNSGTAFVVGGACVATGLCINGAMSVTSSANELSDRVLQAFVGTLIFYSIGQFLLVIGAWVFRKLAQFDVHRTMEHDDNLAVGIAYGGFLMGLGIILRSALVHASPDLVEEILTTLIYAVVGLILLSATSLFTAKVLLPGSPLHHEIEHDRNPAAASVLAAAFICVAVAFAAVVTA